MSESAKPFTPFRAIITGGGHFVGQTVTVYGQSDTGTFMFCLADDGEVLIVRPRHLEKAITYAQA
jgi:hypothetical protein